MSTQYLHGWESIDVPGTGQTINTVPSAIIALTGISDEGAAQTLTLCQNDTDDLQFGAATPMNNIAKTLKIIREVMQGITGSGACTVVVCNVYDDTKHKTALNVTATVTNGVIALSKHIIGDPSTVVIKQNTTAITGTYGTDYTLDKYGNFVDVAGAYEGQDLTFTGYYLSAGSTPGADIVGGIDEDTNARTGLEAFMLCKTKFGFNPKIFITPTYSTLTGVAAKMRAMALSCFGVCLVDAPAGTSYPAAIAGRQSTGTWGWFTSDPSLIPTYPQLQSFDSFVNDNISYPYSAFIAGIMVATDLQEGFWVSPSNHEIPNVTGVEIELTSQYTDPNSETNLLNAEGIMTYLINSGYSAWGNRNASFPTSTDPRNFINIYRTDQMVKESMAAAVLPFMDKGITKALIDVMLQTGNNYVKSLIQQGAYVPGSKITYSADDNPPSDLANGFIKFRRTTMVTPPAERIREYDIFDINLLSSIK